jgi:hypothetical protein
LAFERVDVRSDSANRMFSRYSKKIFAPSKLVAFKKVQNRTVLPWARNEHLALPIHETYAEKANVKIEILLNESDGDHWLYRSVNAGFKLTH